MKDFFTKFDNRYNFDISIFISLIFITGWLSIILGQDGNWDLKNYHLYNAYSFMNDRLLYDIGTPIQWYLNPLVDLPYYFFVTYLADYPKIIAFLQGTYLGALLFVFYKILSSIFYFNSKHQILLAIMSLIGGISGSIVISELGTTFNDIQISLLVFIGLYILIKNINGSGSIDKKYLIFAFCFFGIVAGLKLTASLYGLAALIAVFFSVKNKFQSMLYGIISSFLGFITTGGYWASLMYSKFSNPIFPFYNHIFKSDWYSYSSGSDGRWFPKSITEWIFYPFFWITGNHSVVTEVFFADARILIGLISSLILIAFLLLNKSNNLIFPKQKLILISVFYLASYIVWIKLFSYYRYAMVLEILGIFMMIICIVVILKTNYKYLFSFLASSLIITMTIPANWGRISYSDKYLNIKTPPILNNSIIIAKEGDPPTSYLSLGFSSYNRFIFIGSASNEKNKLSALIESTLANHAGAF